MNGITRNLIVRFLLILVLLVGLLSAGVFLLYRQQVSTMHEQISDEEQVALTATHSNLRDILDTVAADVQILAEMPALLAYLDHGDPDARGRNRFCLTKG
jgi:C4-dicarboxylate-specific signal transduction histidine kinase